MSRDRERRTTGADTIVKSIAKMSLTDLKDFRDGLNDVKQEIGEVKVAVPRLETEMERRLNDLTRDLESRLDERLKRHNEERKEQDRLHTEELKQLQIDLQAQRDRVAALEKELAVAQTKASARGGVVGALSGGGLGGLLIAARELLF